MGCYLFTPLLFYNWIRIGVVSGHLYRAKNLTHYQNFPFLMLFFLITCFSFLLLFQSFSLRPLPPWFRKELSFFTVCRSFKNSLFGGSWVKMAFKENTPLRRKVENAEVDVGMGLLDLPELALECILERLPPQGLCSMGGVCSSLRDRCMSDYFWERHMKEKWGKVLGSAAYREWQWHLASRKDSDTLEQGKPNGLMRLLSRFGRPSWIRSRLSNRNSNSSPQKSSIPVDSFMSWYLALETGKFWFPAQVYNREVWIVTAYSHFNLSLP